MAKLSIDIGVNLGGSIDQLSKLNSSLIEVEKNAKSIASSLQALGKIKVTPQVNVNQTGGGSAAAAPPPPNLKRVDDIFADYNSGVIKAATLTEFLEKKLLDLDNEALRLRQTLQTTQDPKVYDQTLDKLKQVESQTKKTSAAIQAQVPASANATGGYTRLTAAQERQRQVTNLSNLSLINFGRVAQDLPFGILGIANNLNPLIEGLKQTSDAAKASGSSLGKELLNSLKGFGGVTLAISAVSAALSFASVGLSYWTRKSKEAKDATDKLTKDLEKAASGAYQTGINLNQLVVSAQKYAEGSREQTAALNEINKLLGENTEKIDANSLANGRAIQITKQYTDALIAKAVAETFVQEAAKESAKIFTAQQKQQAITNKLGKEGADTAASLAAEFATGGLSLLQWVDAGTKLEKTLKATGKVFKPGDVVRLGQEYLESSYDITAAEAATKKFAESATKAREKFKDTFKGITDTGRIGKLEGDIERVTTEIGKLVDPMGKDKSQWTKLRAELKKYEDELDAIRGVARKSGSTQKTIAQQVSDEYKEINADLAKIEARKDLDPLQKSIKSSERLKQGIDKILDLDIKQQGTTALNKLFATLSGFESKTIGLEIKLLTDNLDTELKRLDERGKILNIDVSKDKLKLFETAIDQLFKKYDDKKISPIDKQTVLSTIGLLQGAIRQLNLDSLVNSGEKAFKDLTIDAEKLNQKKILLGVSIGKEGLNLAKRAIDRINELKIELLSEKDPVRAAQLNDELTKAQSIFSGFRSVAIGESFKEYENAAIRINEEFQRVSQFLRSDKKLEFKIETDKERLNLVSKEIEDELKLGISPIDPRIIFGKILQTKLKLQIEADTESLKLLEDQAKLIRDTLAETFSGIGESIGTALAEGGNVAKAVGKSVLETLGGFLQQLGKQFIAASKLIQTAQILLGTGGGILAGIALVTLGALIKGFASKGFADGGFVSGPGSSRSDSIPARLSNGEYVINAKSVRKYGKGFFDGLNNGSGSLSRLKGGFADGGLVTDSSRGVSRAIVNRFEMPDFIPYEKSRALVNRPMTTTPTNTPYIAETRISGQDLKLILKRADSNYLKTT